MKNYLAIDYGSKNIGLAIKYNSNPIVPLECLHNDQNVITNIQEIINSKNINKIIIGMPYSLSGKIGPQAQIVTEFSEKLRNLTNLPVEFIDERFSSKIVDDQLPNADSLVAYNLLESYIKRSKDD